MIMSFRSLIELVIRRFDGGTPDVLAREITQNLESALEQFSSIQENLEENGTRARV